MLAVLIAGTLDIADALLFYGIRYPVAPTLLLQSIASHILGRSAFTDGVPAALVGLAIHYLIAAAWATVFILSAQHLRFLFHRAIASGVAYGILVYIVMTYFVLPHVILPSRSTQVPLIFVNAVLALILCIGLPISLINSRFAPIPPVS
jgi:hypothetical protein